MTSLTASSTSLPAAVINTPCIIVADTTFNTLLVAKSIGQGGGNDFFDTLFTIDNGATVFVFAGGMFNDRPAIVKLQYDPPSTLTLLEQLLEQ